MSLPIVDETEQKIFMLRVAEQAECYSEMWDMIVPLMKEKALTITPEEKTLIGVACKNYINKDRFALRTVKAIMGLLAYKAQKPLLEIYYNKCVKRYDAACVTIIEALEKNVFEPEKDTKDPKPDAIAFYWQQKADMYRYICESATDDRLDEVKKLAKECYKKASSFNLGQVSLTKLSIGLNYSVFEAEVMKNTLIGVKMSEKLLSDSLEKLDQLPEAEYKEVDSIIEVIKENVQTWKEKIDKEKELAKANKQR